MIKFFRNIRKQLLGEGKTSTYFKYAIGEILLVMIGILLALQVNNWNQDRKDRVKERQALVEIKASIERDLQVYARFYHPRFKQRKKGLDFLKHASYNKLEVPQDSLIKHYYLMGTDIVFRYDNGPYDALKNAGFELVTNQKLRKKIIGNYETFLPIYTRFINGVTDQNARVIQNYHESLITEKIVQTSDGEYETASVVKIDNLLQDASFLELISIEEFKYNNYIRRMNDVEEASKDLILKIENELNNN